jgi:hypothetical protein
VNACSLCEPTHNRSVRETGRCDCVCHRPSESLFNLAYVAALDPDVDVRVTDYGLTAPRRGTLVAISEGPGADVLVQWDQGGYVTSIPAAKFNDRRYAISTRRRPAR